MYQLANKQQIFFGGIIMLRLGETKIAKEKFYAAKEKTKQTKQINVCNIDINN